MEDKYSCQASLLQQQHAQQQQQFAERILEHLAFNSDILERWHQIGSAQGLSTDLEVATFLIQQWVLTVTPPRSACLAIWLWIIPHLLVGQTCLREMQYAENVTSWCKSVADNGCGLYGIGRDWLLFFSWIQDWYKVRMILFSLS